MTRIGGSDRRSAQTRHTEQWIDALAQTWRARILAYILLGRQWRCLMRWVRLPIFGDDIVGKWVGERRTEEAQDKSTNKERYGVGHDLFVDRAETHIMPIEGRGLRSAEQQCPDPIGGAEDRNQGPGIVEKGAYHECEKVEAQCPGQEQHDHGV